VAGLKHETRPEVEGPSGPKSFGTGTQWHTSNYQYLCVAAQLQNTCVYSYTLTSATEVSRDPRKEQKCACLRRVGYQHTNNETWNLIPVLQRMWKFYSTDCPSPSILLRSTPPLVAAKNQQRMAGMNLPSHNCHQPQQTPVLY